MPFSAIFKEISPKTSRRLAKKAFESQKRSLLSGSPAVSSAPPQLEAPKQCKDALRT